MSLPMSANHPTPARGTPFDRVTRSDNPSPWGYRFALLFALLAIGCTDPGQVGLGRDGQLQLFIALTVMSVLLWIVRSWPTRVLAVVLAVPAVVVAMELWL